MSDFNFPTCPEICKDCESGIHIFHVINELGDVWAKKQNSEPGQQIQISGFAEDEFWFKHLLQCVCKSLRR